MSQGWGEEPADGGGWDDDEAWGSLDDEVSDKILVTSQGFLCE